MEVDENSEKKVNDDIECIDVESSLSENQRKSAPNTPNCDKRTSLLNKSNLNSAEKLDKNLRLQIKLENAKKREEEKAKKEKEKREREEAWQKKQEEWKRKREEEELLKQKKAEEREREKERKAAELAEKERQKQEALKKREEEKKAKDEEKRLKEEERKQKEEEKRKKEEEKLREEEEKKQKELKVKSQFKSFFIKKETPVNERNEEYKNLRFMPFQLKENMTCAPLCRRDDYVHMNDEQREEFFTNLDNFIHNSEENTKLPNYLEEIRKNPNLIRKREIRSRRKTHPKLIDESSNDDIKEITLQTNSFNKFRVKYLHFDPKVYKRPPYYGTWRKKSKIIGPRRPFAKDDQIFAYEFDSDDEWEEEPEGESICDSEKDEDEEVIDDDEDDGFFVPHGHLSDDEIDEEEKDIDPEIKKARETKRSEQWELERKKASKFLIPKCFIVPNYNQPDNCYKNDSKIVDEIKLFERLKAIILSTQLPINLNEPNSKNDESTQKTVKYKITEASPSAAKSIKSQKSKLQLNPQSPINPTHIQTVTNTASPNATPSIIKFISKMSKKDIVCKLEPLNSGATGQNSSTTIAPLSPLPTKVTANFATPGTPNSPKMTPTSTAEKRVCSGNGENAVKRLKLDDNQSNEQKNPSTPNSIINMFKKTGSCKKSLKMAAKSENTDIMECEVVKVSQSPSKKMEVDVENEKNKKDNKENNSVNLITID
ncbi:unnamed protein product [Brachionus calyciflorus]|uniref:Chromatin assembly factor 1 subunit A n=1 Tax=Brachionus calyciflorus TaxID=104777 RepID=A0A813TRK3_9BILA|nr:unnamed protein product [Brachionus calyciflorus]